MEQLVDLKKFRKEMKLTQTMAAQEIGIDQRQWNRYENGKNELPIRYLKAICQKWNVSADKLLELNTEERSDNDT